MHSLTNVIWRVSSGISIAVINTVCPCVQSRLKKIWEALVSVGSWIKSCFCWSDRVVTPLHADSNLKTAEITAIAKSQLFTAYENLFTEKYETLEKVPRRVLTGLLKRAESLQSQFPNPKLDSLINSLRTLLSPEVTGAPLALLEDKIPGDGNCLFEAIARGLRQNIRRLSGITHLGLRMRTIEFIERELKEAPENNDFTPFITGAIEGFKDAEKAKLEMEQICLQYIQTSEGDSTNKQDLIKDVERQLAALDTITPELYLTMAKQEGFFCGELEIKALATIFEDITIIVHNKNEDAPTQTYGKGETKIHILYNGIDHYDRYDAIVLT